MDFLGQTGVKSPLDANFMGMAGPHSHTNALLEAH
jgi:hypothetical protein